MSRLIDADALMVELMDSDLDHLQRDDWKEVIQIVTDAPTIAPEPHWIPVIERLPENSRNVLITSRCGVSVAWYNGSYFEKGANTHHRKIQTVTAWCELPEPYKEKE